MAIRTRAQLITLYQTLFSSSSPKLSKSSHQAFMADLVDSASNWADDATGWLKPVKGMANTPPALFDQGDRWIVGATPTGAWAGNAGKLATAQAGDTWSYTDIPDRAVLPSSADANTYYVREGGTTQVCHLSKTRLVATTSDASVYGDVLDTITATRIPMNKLTAYLLDAVLLVQSTYAGAGVHVTLGADAALDTISWRLDTLNADGSPAVQVANALGGGAPTNGVPTANTTYVLRLQAMVKTLSTATDIYLQLASSDASRMARLMTGSTLQLTPLA